MSWKKDLFVNVIKVLNGKDVLVRVINRAGTPYSLILIQREDGTYLEVMNSPTYDAPGFNCIMNEDGLVENYCERFARDGFVEDRKVY